MTEKARRIIGITKFPPFEPLSESRELLRNLHGGAGGRPFPGKLSARVTDYILRCPDLDPSVQRILSAGAYRREGGRRDGPPFTSASRSGFILAALACGSEYGFPSAADSPPRTAFCLKETADGSGRVILALPDAYLKRILKKDRWLNILAQILIREILENLSGAPPIRARLSELRLNSFHAHGSLLSDLTRDMLETCADLHDFSTLELLAAGSSMFQADIRALPGEPFSETELEQIDGMIASIAREARFLLRLSRLEDYSTGAPLNITPKDIIFETTRAELTVQELPALYAPPYLAGVLKEALAEAGLGNSPDSGVRILRDIIAYRPPGDLSTDTELSGKIREWVDLYLDFSERNLVALSILQSGIMSEPDLDEVKELIEGMIGILQALDGENPELYRKELGEVLGPRGNEGGIALALNRLINRIHQDVLKNVFGVFKGWKARISEVNTIAGKALGVAVDQNGVIEYFPASKVNILDYSGDFRDGPAAVARKIIESYLTTNIHLRDNCYIDCISHTTKAWFFVDLGVHGAHIFVDTDPYKPLITAGYAEGGVEDGNMERLRLLMNCLEDLGFEVAKTEVTLTARLDEKSAGVLGTHEIIECAIRTIQAFASVADFDQEIEDGRITQRSLKIHSRRISSSGTGYPLYLMTKGSIALKKLSETLDSLTSKLLPTLNRELSRLGLETMNADDRGQKLIDRRFNQPIRLGLGQGRFLSYPHAPVVPNPSCSEPDPGEVFEMDEDLSLSEETASMVSTLDKVTGSTPVSEMDGGRITRTRIDLVEGAIAFYALRDQNTYQALRAFVTAGPCFRRVCGFDNRIQDPSSVKKLLSEHGYHLDLIEQLFQWTVPKCVSVKGIRIPGIISCPGIATGFLKKNRPEYTPEDFQHCIYFDHILTPQDVGRLKGAAGFITSGDSTLSHAQLTARSFGKPGVIIPGSCWIDEGNASYLLAGGAQGYRIREGQVITVDGFRGMVTVVGASADKGQDFSGSIREVFSLCVGSAETRHPDGSLKRLREIISCTDNIEILKFIARELFLSGGTLEEERRFMLLKSLLDDPHPVFGDAIRGSLMDMALEDRRRQKSDIEMAYGRIARTGDMTEARFIRDRIAVQIRLFEVVDRLLSERLNLARMDFTQEAGRIEGLYEDRLKACAQEILEEAESLLVPGDAPPENIERAWRKTVLFDRLASASPSCGQALAGIRARIEDRLAGLRGTFRQSPGRYVAKLRDIRGYLEIYTGNKAATLGSLINTHPDLMIPDGFVLTTLGVRRLMDHNRDGVSRIETLIRDRHLPKGELLAEVYAAAAAFSWPEALEREILSHYRELERGMDAAAKVSEIHRISDIAGLPRPDPSSFEGRAQNDRPTIGGMIRKAGPDRGSAEALEELCREQSGPFVVVRSSSVLEDTHEEMMAGRFKSYPYIRGRSLLLESIIRCLAYYWVELSEVSDTQPVLVHSQVESDAAMVINSINLADQRWDEVVINSAIGAGAGLVAGRVDSDLFLVDADTCCIRRSINPRKKTRTVFDCNRGYGTTTAPVENSSEQIRASLSDDEASRAARMARRIHAYLGYPVDIEAVMRDGVIHVVQVRPIVLPLPSHTRGAG